MAKQTAKQKMANMRRKASAKIDEVKSKSKGKVDKALAKLKTAKMRRNIEAVEVAAGGAAAGVAHGLGVDVPVQEFDVPIGLPVGAVAVVIGSVLDQPDLQAFGLGGATYGLGRFLEDAVAV